jgi:hypothetical protein
MKASLPRPTGMRHFLGALCRPAPQATDGRFVLWGLVLTLENQ